MTVELQDIFKTDLKDTDEVAVFLLPQQTEKLLPQLEKMKPGSRIIAHQFEIPGVPADQTVNVESADDGCSQQARAYREELAKIEGLGGEIVGVSGDEVATHRLFRDAFELKHSLLADSKGELAKFVGVPVSAGGCVRGAHADRTPILNDNGTTIILKRPLTVARWTVVVGRDGKVASNRTSVDPVTDPDEVCLIVASMAR